MRVGGAGEEVGGVGLQALGGLLKRKNSSVASTEWTLIKDVCVCCLEKIEVKSVVLGVELSPLSLLNQHVRAFCLCGVVREWMRGRVFVHRRIAGRTYECVFCVNFSVDDGSGIDAGFKGRGVRVSFCEDKLVPIFFI